MRTDQDTIVATLQQRYDALGTYRAVAESLNEPVSCMLVWRIINEGVYSHKVARALGFGRKYPPYLKIRRDDMSKAAASIRDNLEPGQVADLKRQL